ncbi:Auxin Efflux Carrier [Denitrovibrio acetiphilus DSM 12809]|uniref:Auxin Efflux Carrier n=1 Tax=Denitrovibrio acetiphilus (strain DSM 12809 / NBRC 114555 / N2460) TaxID=522772 RepID=D4H0Q8_DENA2|nr:AEC family transporter [Denitrovibrio acetiphilus]ADD68571.1 Auxin Efflux Carrier [Denitrovibrio acetiphilus DSM 12809]
MDNLILLIICFVVGFISRKFKTMPEETPLVLNSFLINLSLPAISFMFMHEMHFNTKLLFPVLMPWICFIAAYIFFKILQKICGFSQATTGCLILTVGLGNTSFVGLPMITAFYGAEYIGIGVLCDQPGSFLVLSTLGVIVATTHSSGSISFASLLKKVISFPPLQAVALGLIFRTVPLPEWSINVMKGFGATITPLAMVSVGYQLKFALSDRLLSKLATGLLFKLFLAPALIYFIYVVVLNASGIEMQVTIFEAAMGPMITAGIIAMQYNLDKNLATMLMGVGIPASLLSLVLWYYLLSGV